MIVATLGPKGTFSEEALSQFIDCEIAYAHSISALFEALGKGDVEKIFCPIENSSGGEVANTIDGLISNNFYINQEYIAKISQNLLTKQKLKLSEIKKIYSHPQAIAQCESFIRNNLPNAEIILTKSTAESASMLSELDVCIGNIGLKDEYNLHMLKENIQDEKDNSTKFVLISKEKSSLGNKTSIAFSIENKPGELYKMLSVFNIFGINMLKIISRPFRGGNWEYIFFVDLENTETLQAALDVVKSRATFYKELGSY